MEFTDPKLQEAYEKNKELIDRVTSEDTKKIWVAALAGYDKSTIKEMYPDINPVIVGLRYGNINKRLHPEQYANRVRKKTKRKSQDEEILHINEVGGSMKDDNIEDSLFEDSLFDEDKKDMSDDSAKQLLDRASRYAKIKDKLELAKYIVLLERKLNETKGVIKPDVKKDFDFKLDDNFLKTLDEMAERAQKRQLQMEYYRRTLDAATPSKNKSDESSELIELKRMFNERFDKLEKESEIEKALRPYKEELTNLKNMYSQKNNPEMVKLLEKLEDKVSRSSEDKTQEFKNLLLLMNEIRGKQDDKGTDWKAILQMRQQDDDRNKLLFEKSTEMDKQRQQEQMELFKQSMDLRLQQMGHEFSRMVEEHKKPQGTDISEWIKQYRAIQELSNTVKGEPPSTFDRAIESLAPSIPAIADALSKSRQPPQPSVDLRPEEINMINEYRRQEIERMQKQQTQQTPYQPSQNLMPEEPAEPVKKKKYLVENL